MGRASKISALLRLLSILKPAQMSVFPLKLSRVLYFSFSIPPARVFNKPPSHNFSALHSIHLTPGTISFV